MEDANSDRISYTIIIIIIILKSCCFVKETLMFCTLTIRWGSTCGEEERFIVFRWENLMEGGHL